MKTPDTSEPVPSAPSKRNFTKASKFTPRQRRVLSALWDAGGWIWRESIDRIAKASNGPEVIRQLRHGYMLEIDMEQIEILDADGRPSRPGRYRLTDRGRHTLMSLGWMPDGLANG